MNKWMKNEQARKNIARKWEMVELYDLYKVKPKQRENITNYAHRVWLNNIHLVPDYEIVEYQHGIVAFDKELHLDPDYLSLLNGTASDELIRDTLGNYYAGRKCSK